MKNLLLAALAFVAFNLNAQNISIKAIPAGPLCHGAATGSIDLIIDGGTSPYTYLWSTGETTPSIANLVAGSYSVTVNDNGGLISTSTIIIGEPDAIGLTGFVINCSAAGAADGSINLSVRGGTPDFTYAWDNGATTEDVINLAAGVYTVVVTDGFGCQANLSKIVHEPGGQIQLASRGNVGHGGAAGHRSLEVPENDGSLNLNAGMYPNPASNFLSVKIGGAEQSELRVFNNNGEMVSTQNFNSDNTKVDVSNLPAGNYVVQVKNASGIINKNISVVK